MIGEILAGKYKVERRIGRGAFGSVYRAFDMLLKRHVAVKVLNTVGDNERFKRRFQLESESLAKLNHMNIVTLFDCGEHDGRPYQVMEIVNGVTLMEMAGNSKLTNTEIYNICLQISLALDYAHNQGVVHRDLTLKNIMVEKDENGDLRAKIVDFGLAKILHAEVQTTGREAMGTPHYMAPEQINCAAIDGRTDIFAFGVDLFRLLNGRFPFEAEHPTAVMYQIVHQTDLSFVDGIPEDLKQIIANCLEKDPRNRPANFRILAEDFEILRNSVTKPIDLSTSIEFPGAMVERSSKRNPYLNRLMIKNRSDFFGREREVRKIYSRLDAPHPQSISVVGDRRIGKSSLMNHVYNRVNRKKYMQNHDNAIFVYLDFQGSADFNVARFIDFLFNVFSYETKATEEYAASVRTLDTLKQAIQNLHESGRRVVVLMDEFESITKNPNFDAGFFSFLRSLANSYRIAYVTSSRDELQMMCHNQDISDSPFFNIFSNLPLRPFSRQTALELIDVPSRREGVPLAPHASTIIEWAGYFPLFLQIACSNVFEHVLDESSDLPDWPRIFRSFREEVFPHYEFIWEHAEGPERENMVRIAHGKKINRKYEFVTENLLRRGFLREHGGEISLFSEAFKYFVLKQEEKEGRRESFFSRMMGRGRG